MGINNGVSCSLVKTRFFFVSDVHGSERCFRKFINAGKFYGVNNLILGGDITGKIVIPIIKHPDESYECNYNGSKLLLHSKEQLETTSKIISDGGSYPFLTTSRESEELASHPELVKQLFVKLMRERLKGWMRMAEERLQGTNISCYISPGNDDYYEIDDLLNSSSYSINPEERVVALDGDHEMITLGIANPTPWHSPRELSEELLLRKIELLVAQVRDVKKAVFNFHVPPINTPIDQAPKLDDALKPVVSGGQMLMTSAGSTAVRKSIEMHQPLIGLHGHIHESRGYVRIGRTVCFNPGSDYGSGVLKGLICEIESDRIKSYVLPTG